MKYQIDQSGKIENTGVQTVLAVSNHAVYTVAIPAKVKRQFQEICRRNGLTRLYVYILFAIGVHALIVKLKTRSNIIIDTEYPGKEKLIKDLIKKKADKTISFQETLKATKKTDGRLRECLSTLVGAQSRPVNGYYQQVTKKSRKNA